MKNNLFLFYIYILFW